MSYLRSTFALLCFILLGCNEQAAIQNRTVEENNPFLDYKGRVCVRLIYFANDDQRSSSIILDGPAQNSRCISYEPLGSVGDTLMVSIHGRSSFICE